MNKIEDDKQQETVTSSIDNKVSQEQEYLSMSSFMPEKTTTYRTKKDLYDDNYSSAIILLIFGVLGILLLILNYVGIIKIFYSLYQYTVGFIMFLVFILIAIYTFNKAKIYKRDIEKEDTFTIGLKKFLSENISQELLETFDSDNTTDEENYLSRITNIKKIVCENFGDLDDNYIDSIIEDFYNDNF